MALPERTTRGGSVGRSLKALGSTVLLVPAPPGAADRELTLRDVQGLIEQAETRHLVGCARKTRVVDRDKFGERYQMTGRAPGPEGWREARPVGKVLRFFRIPEEQRRFTFTAPWGERMVAVPGDAIVQDPEDPGDIYRVAARSFECTYGLAAR